MNFNDPYQAYVEGTVFSGNPLGMVIALYEGTIDSIGQARHALAARDIMGRSKAINKAVNLLTELLVTLDHQEGGEVSANLKRLYSYIQCRLLDAHMKQIEEPMIEAEILLGNVLEGWREAAIKLEREGRGKSPLVRNHYQPEPEPLDKEPAFGYNFFVEAPEAAAGFSATF